MRARRPAQTGSTHGGGGWGRKDRAWDDPERTAEREDRRPIASAPVRGTVAGSERRMGGEPSEPWPCIMQTQDSCIDARQPGATFTPDQPRSGRPAGLVSRSPSWERRSRVARCSARRRPPNADRAPLACTCLVSKRLLRPGQPPVWTEPAGPSRPAIKTAYMSRHWHAPSGRS